MPTVKNVERKIAEIEGFDVIIRQNNSDVRSDKNLPKQYPYDRGRKNNCTVNEWRRCRFEYVFPGYSVDVLYEDGTVATGQTKLEAVRDSYNIDDPE